MNTTKTNRVEKLVVPMGRLQYVHLDVPTAPPESEQAPSYQVTLIWDSETDLEAVKGLIEQQALSEFGAAKLKQLRSKGKFKSCLKSNSTKTYFNEEGEELPARGFEDAEGFHMTFKTKNKDWLKIWDSARNPISADAVIAGHWARAQAGFMAYNVGGGTGVTAYLNAIQVCKADEPFNQTVVDDGSDFEAYNGDGAVLADDIS